MKTRRQKNSKRITRRKTKRKFRGGELESMPQLCFGTAQANLEKMLELALRIGYRHIDGADAYSGRVIKLIERARHQALGVFRANKDGHGGGIIEFNCEVRLV